jgi:hypothetical protein
MADKGAINTVINATEVKLYLTANTNEYVLLQEIELVLDRPETREAVALGSVYFFGQHNNIFDATILLSGPEIKEYLDLNSLSTGALTSGTYLIECTPKTGVAETITVDAVVPRLSFEKLAEGGVKFRARFRITEEVTSADVTP